MGIVSSYRHVNRCGYSVRSYGVLLLATVLTACGGGGGGSSSVSNMAPTIAGSPVTIAVAGSAYTFVPTATDADGGVLTFTIFNKPVWAVFDTQTGELGGTPTNSDMGVTTDIVISVTDGIAPEVPLPAFDLTVNKLNTPPTISGSPDTSIAEDSAYSFVPTASDADTDPVDTLTFSIQNMPGWAAFDTATGELAGMPGNSDVGTTTGIVISVTDGIAAEVPLPAFDLEVTNVNDAPTISGTPSERVSVGVAYSFVPTVVDVDPTNDTLTFTIQNKPSWAAFNTTTGALTGTPGNGQAGTTTTGILIEVDDGIAAPVGLPVFDISVLESFNEALYALPSVSSASAPEKQYQANDGIDTVASNGWRVDGAAPGGPHWIRLDFDSVKSIHRVSLTGLLGLTPEVQSVRLDFSDSTSRDFTLSLPSNNGVPQDIVFDPPKQTEWIQVTVTQVTGAGDYGLAEITAYSSLDPGQTTQAEDLFNDGDSTGWTLVDNCLKAGSSSAWDPAFFFWSGAGNQYRQTGDCRGFSDEGVELGTYRVLGGVNPTGMDLRLNMRSDDTGEVRVNGAMGVLFAYQNDNNYYRLDLSQREGHRKLWKKQAGVFTELNTSPQSYTPGDWPSSYSSQAWVNLRVVHLNGVIIVYLDGEKIMAAEDLTFSGGQIALFCARNRSCTYDNVILLDAPSDPIVGTNIADEDTVNGVGLGHASGEYFVSAGAGLDVAAAVTSSAGVGSVEFVLDEGLGNEVSLTDFAPPYVQQFNLLSAGDHTVSTYLLDDVGQRLPSAKAAHALPKVGTGGIFLVALGDSITGGLGDDLPADDISMDGRNTSGGYQTVLNDLLSADNPIPVTVLNEGNAGETSSEGVLRMMAVVERTPAAQAYLTIYGANDSSESMPPPSGAGLTCTSLNPISGCDSGYLGSFKHNMQRMINAAADAGKQLILAKAPPHLTNGPRDALIQGYNNAVEQVVTENGFGYTPPDFHTFFSANPGLMVDALHPNGLGYREMADLWCQSLNGQMGIFCTP